MSHQMQSLVDINLCSEGEEAIMIFLQLIPLVLLVIFVLLIAHKEVPLACFFVIYPLKILSLACLSLAITWPQGVLVEVDSHAVAAQVHGGVRRSVHR
jgi:hypothetical protein